jgi:hypothetical protein
MYHEPMQDEMQFTFNYYFLRRELVRKPQPPKEFKKMKIWCPVKESYHRTISDELQVAQKKYVKK